MASILLKPACICITKVYADRDFLTPIRNIYVCHHLAYNKLVLFTQITELIQ